MNHYYNKIIKVFSSWKKCTRVHVGISKVIDYIIKFAYTEKCNEIIEVVDTNENFRNFKNQIIQNHSFIITEQLVQSHKHKFSVSICDMVQMLKYIINFVSENIANVEHGINIEKKYLLLTTFYSNYKFDFNVINNISINNFHFVNLLLHCDDIKTYNMLSKSKNVLMAKINDFINHELNIIKNKNVETKFCINKNYHYKRILNIFSTCNFRVYNYTIEKTIRDILHLCILIAKSLNVTNEIILSKRKNCYNNISFLPSIEHLNRLIDNNQNPNNNEYKVRNKKLRDEYIKFCDELDKK